MEAKSAQEDYDRVKNDLKTLQDDLAKLTRAVTEGQKAKVSNLRDEIRRESEEAYDDLRKRGDKAYSQAREAGERAYGQARDAGGKAIQGAEHKIEERPFLTVLIAFVAGLLVSKLFDR